MKMSDEYNFVLEVLLIQVALLKHRLYYSTQTHTFAANPYTHSNADGRYTLVQHLSKWQQLSRHKTSAFRWNSHTHSHR